MSKIIESLLTANGGDSSSLLKGLTVSNTVLDGASIQETMLYMRDHCSADITLDSYREELNKPGNKNAQIFLFEINKSLSFVETKIKDNTVMACTLFGALADEIDIIDKNDEFASGVLQVLKAPNFVENAYDICMQDYANEMTARADKYANADPTKVAEDKARLQKECQPRYWLCIIKRNGISCKFTQLGTKKGKITPSEISALITSTLGGYSKQEKKEVVEKRTANIFVA